MSAQDAVPSRLGLAIEAARGWIDALGEGDRAGVVAFAGRGVPRCPLTDRRAAAIDALEALRPGAINPGGSDLEAGLLAALDLARDPSREAPPILVAISDGESHSESWRRLLGPLREAGAIVHAVAVGDGAAGHPMPTGAGDVLRGPDGAPVLTRRRDAPLRALAETTGGRFIPLGTAAGDAAEVFRAEVAPGLHGREIPGGPAERFGIFAALAAGALVIPRGLRGGRRRRAGLLALLLVAALAAAGPSGRDDFLAGRRAQALASFEEDIREAPGQPIPLFNAGVTLIHLGRFDEAERRLLQAREGAEPPLLGKIDYALGNVRLALGDPEGAIQRYDESLGSLPEGSSLRDDTLANRAFAVECRAQTAAEAPRPDEPGRRAHDPDRDPSERAEDEEKRDGPPPNNATPAPTDDPGAGKPQAPRERLARTWERIEGLRKRRDAPAIPKVVPGADPIW
jgi:Ca-activated chloride channel family protein